MSKSYDNEGMLSQGTIYIAAFILRTSFHGVAVITAAFQYAFLTSCAQSHLTALPVKHCPIAGAVSQTVPHHTVISVLFS